MRVMRVILQPLASVSSICCLPIWIDVFLMVFSQPDCLTSEPVTFRIAIYSLMVPTDPFSLELNFFSSLKTFYRISDWYSLLELISVYDCLPPHYIFS